MQNITSWFVSPQITKIKDFYHKYKILIPIIILTFYCVIMVKTAFIDGESEINGYIYDFELGTKHYGALGAIIVNFTAFIFFRQLYKYILLITVLAGLFNFINFTPAEHTSFIRIGSIKLGVQPLSFWVGILTFLIGYKRIFEIYKEEFGKTPEQILIDDQKKFEEDIEKYKNMYQDASNEHLIQISEDKRYTDSALEAVKQLISQRQKTNP